MDPWYCPCQTVAKCPRSKIWKWYYRYRYRNCNTQVKNKTLYCTPVRRKLNAGCGQQVLEDIPCNIASYIRGCVATDWSEYPCWPPGGVNVVAYVSPICMIYQYFTCCWAYIWYLILPAVVQCQQCQSQKILLFGRNTMLGHCNHEGRIVDSPLK